jgi:putative aldouronate transport system substrate-binding protein
MTSKMLKMAALFLLLTVLSAGMVFAGGRSQSSGSGGKQTLVIGMESNSFITDYKNNYMTQHIEKLHDIDIQFYMLPEAAAEIRTKVALMVSSGDLPDIVITDDLTQEAVFQYGSGGAFIPLDKYFASPATAPYFYQIPEEDRKAYQQFITSADNHIYQWARYEPETWNLTPVRLYYNQTWSDKLGIKTPTTTEELRQALIAFKARDANGNGRQDEIGISGWFRGGYGESVITGLINSFVFYTQGSTGRS